MSRINRLVEVLVLVVALSTSGCFLDGARAQDTRQREPLVGRVEEIAGGGQPLLPRDLLEGGAASLETGVKQSGTLPLAFKGQWEGNVKITQMDIYPAQHPEPYCQQFIAEIKRYFRLGKNGILELRFAPTTDG